MISRGLLYHAVWETSRIRVYSFIIVFDHFVAFFEVKSKKQRRSKGSNAVFCHVLLQRRLFHRLAADDVIPLKHTIYRPKSFFLVRPDDFLQKICR